MGKFATTKVDIVVTEIEGKRRALLRKSAYNRFDVNLLGLGDVSKEAKAIDSIAAVFDLEGFTNFCKQIEPHLSVPLFLSEFLTWIFERLKAETLQKEYPEGVLLYSDLPYMLKFMGDGLLVLWDATNMPVVARRNVLVEASEICNAYKSKFLPRIRKKVVDPPLGLRCGLARGTVYSVGGGDDYVGSCINMAARLQKLPGVSLAFNIRGFDLEGGQPAKFFTTGISVRKVSIRGIGDNELIALRSRDLTSMGQNDAKLYRAV